MDSLVPVAFDYISSSWKSRLINTAIELNIYDHLSQRSMTTEELAEATNTHSPTLFRFMRALSSIKVFTLNEDQKWATTPLATVIYAKFQRLSTVIHELDAAFSKLADTVKTGKCHFEDLYGLKMYDWYKCKPESMRSFVAAMHEYCEAFESKLLESYDFSQFRHIVDVGGGQGGLMSKILKIAPNAVGTVFDQEIVLDEAGEKNIVKDVRDRISFVSGNFMTKVPSGGDCYILHNILLDYNDEDALTILRNIAEKMDENTKLVVIKQSLDSSIGAMHDIQMLVILEGKIRSENEFEILLAKAGLRLSKFLKIKNEIFEVLEARKIVQ